MTENGFLVYTQDRCLKNINTSPVIPCYVKWIPEILIMEKELLEDGGILLIINASERHACDTQFFSTAQVGRLTKHKA